MKSRERVKSTIFEMGNVSSRIDDRSALFLRDQSRCRKSSSNLDRSRLICTAVSVASLTVVNARRKVLAIVSPNAHPAGQVGVRKEQGDEGLLEYIQVGDMPSKVGICF